VVATETDVSKPPVSAAEPVKVDHTQKRIDELTWKTRELERQLAQERAAKQAEPPKPTPVEPTLEQFEFDQAKYDKARREYDDARIEQRVAEVLERREREKQVKTVEQTFEERQRTFAEKNPEYVEKVLRGAERQEWACSQAMATVLKGSERGPEVALYLATHPDESISISRLPDLEAARELGRIEARLEKPVTSSAPPKVSNAPPPPPKIDAADATVSVKPTDPESDKLSDQEWLKAREKQVARRKSA
jgi:hypothetical protein